MSWQVLMLAHTLLTAASILFLRSLAKQKQMANASFAVNAATYTAQYAVGLLLVLCLGNVQWNVHREFLVRLAFGGLGFALYNICTYKLLTYLDAATSSILGTFKVLFTIMLAAFFLQEDLHGLQIVGAIVLMTAIIYTLMLAKDTDEKTHANRWIPGVAFAIIGSLIFALANTNEKYLLGYMNISTYLFFGWGWQFLISLGLGLTQYKKIKLLKTPKRLTKIMMVALTTALAGYLFILSAVKSDNIALVTVVGNFKLIVVAVLSAWLLKERQKLKEKIIATLTATAGLALIFWK